MPKRIGFLFVGLLLFFGTESHGRAPIDFERQILPILESRCFECHRGPTTDSRGRTRKPKAGLRLDGKEWIRKGSEESVVLVPGKPDGSLLYKLIALPPGDPDLMPAKGDPLSKEEIERIRLWIEEGASFGKWVGEAGSKKADIESETGDSAPASIRLLRKLSLGVPLASREAIERASGDVARIAEAIPDSPLLRVEFISNEEKVVDSVVARLEELAPQITCLNLARTAITDRALETVGRWTGLTRLDLRETRITDAGLSHLAGLEHLRYLNLFGTEITDDGLEALSKLPNLEALYLWQTKVTDAGAARLRQKLPHARVNLRPALPGSIDERSNEKKPSQRRK